MRRSWEVPTGGVELQDHPGIRGEAGKDHPELQDPAILHLCPAGLGPGRNWLLGGPRNWDKGGSRGLLGMLGRAFRGKQALPISCIRWEAGGDSGRAAGG